MLWFRSRWLVITSQPIQLIGPCYPRDIISRAPHKTVKIFIIFYLFFDLLYKLAPLSLCYCNSLCKISPYTDSTSRISIRSAKYYWFLSPKSCRIWYKLHFPIVRVLVLGLILESKSKWLKLLKNGTNRCRLLLGRISLLQSLRLSVARSM